MGAILKVHNLKTIAIQATFGWKKRIAAMWAIMLTGTVVGNYLKNCYNESHFKST